MIDFTVEIETYMERIGQVYHHYTVNDHNTLGMNGFLRLLKDLNLLKNFGQHGGNQMSHSKSMTVEERQIALLS